ncbi:MAG: hypothetical protein M3256_23160, partial [Actinomycetota bacterium]|nr:hypothetical protein [Actinomycetota bacterium]
MPGWLAGSWYHHDLGVSVSSSGKGSMTWRVGNCGDQPPPCDAINGDGIIDGGNAAIVFRVTGPTTASGTVLSTTKPSDVPLGPITARLDAGTDLVYLSTP